MKYKIGDIVKVRDDLVINEYYGETNFIYGMDKFKGEFVTIEEVDNKNKTYNIKEYGWYWTDEMFEDIDNELDYKKLLKNNDNTFKLFSAIVKNADYEYQKIVKINPIALHYENEGEKLYIKYVCPICQSLGVRLQLEKGKSNCSNCNVNLNWGK